MICEIEIERRDIIEVKPALGDGVTLVIGDVYIALTTDQAEQLAADIAEVIGGKATVQA